jgi:hypothetical protein
VSTPEIYKGGLAFIAIQLFMVVMVIVFPGMVVGDAQKGEVDLDKVKLEAEPGYYRNEPPAVPPPEPGKDGAKSAPDAAGSAPPSNEPAEEDPMEAVRRALQSDAAKK